MRRTGIAPGVPCAICVALAWMAAATAAAPPATKPRDKHWSFEPIRRPAVPVAASPDDSRNPIDRFVIARLDAEGMSLAAPADRRTLLRRLYLDLVGLPPTPDDVSAFLADPSPDATARVVDRLLARPEYGERWGRHWLDLVRYAETNGYERDGAKPSAWRYRDYVIDSLNRDKPYDEFLTEQLAGDELPRSNAAAQIATTFLRLGTWDDEPPEPLVDRYDQLDDVLGTTATAFLGITLRCARCHDHKFEPFSQVDYYRMLAIFEPLKRPQQGRTELDRPVGSEAEVANHAASIARIESEAADLWVRATRLFKPEIDGVLAIATSGKGAATSKKKPLVLPAEAVKALRAGPGGATNQQRALIVRHAGDVLAAALSAALESARVAAKPFQERFAALHASRPAPPPRAYIWAEETANPPITHVFKRGDPTRPGTCVEPGVPAVLSTGQLPGPARGAHSSGRRLWLARWISSPDNPLTARVIVNRIWQFHFGQGLVASSSDLGVMGDAPSHPELLDWLASELIANGWRWKPLHRLIVLSRTYQQSARFDVAAFALDPTNALLWRWPQRRLDAEVVRDMILAVSGELSGRMGGPGFYPTLPREVLEGQSRPGEGWGSSEPGEQARRSIYIFAKRSLAVPELELLDAPDTTGSCERRTTSTTGPQALTFLNGKFAHDRARRFAARLAAEAGDSPGDQVDRAFALALSRPPRADERQTALEFLKAQEAQIETEARQPPRTRPVNRRAPQGTRVVLPGHSEYERVCLHQLRCHPGLTPRRRHGP